MGAIDLFVRISVGVLVGGLLGAGLAWATQFPAWGIGASAGAASAIVSSFVLHSLRQPPREDGGPPDTPAPPST